jgi:hypothetical protein
VVSAKARRWAEENDNSKNAGIMRDVGQEIQTETGDLT